MAEIETSEVNVNATLDPQDIRVSIEDVIVIKGQDADIAAAEAATSAANEAATLANEAATNANNAALSANNAAESANNAAINANESATNADTATTNANAAATEAHGAAVNANETANTIKQRADSGEFNGKDGSDATATDVRINGSSIVVDGVADIPAAKANTLGLFKSHPNYGFYYGFDNNIFIQHADSMNIDARSNSYQPITPANLDYAVKAAMCDGKGASWTADEQKAARERMNAADANKVYIMQKQIENLQGIAATEETDSTEAYTKAVPTGAQKWASIDKVGGKTVVWNQLYRRLGDTAPSGGLNAEYKENGHIRIFTDAAGIQSDIMFYFMNLFSNDVLPDGHKYLINAPYGGTGKYRVSAFSSTGARVLDAYEGPEIYSASEPVARLAFVGLTGWVSTAGLDFNPFIIDLTSAFGKGNEPTSLDDPRIAFIKAYAEEHPEYNPGELMSAEVVEVVSKGTFQIPAEVRNLCPGYGWSAGTACNEIDFERKVYVQRVGSVDLSTLKLSKGNASNIDEGYFGYYLNVSDSFPQMKPSANAVCERFYYHPQTIMWEDMPADSFFSNAYLHFQAKYDKIEDFKAAMQGVMLYYELAEPIEVDLSNVLPDDHFIEVEAGGTCTFKQASTQLPVPSSVTYQISTKEVVANA